jgi:glycerol-3-phosphate acyltransferase PlsX
MLKRELLTSTLAAKIGTWLARGGFRRFARFVDYAEYGGAPLLGLQGIAIVCHGKSNAKAITNATKMAATFVRKQTNQRLVENISANEELIRFGKAIKYGAALCRCAYPHEQFPAYSWLRLQRSRPNCRQ